jgi:hypothetical protein
MRVNRRHRLAAHPLTMSTALSLMEAMSCGQSSQITGQGWTACSMLGAAAAHAGHRAPSTERIRIAGTDAGTPEFPRHASLDEMASRFKAG